MASVQLGLLAVAEAGAEGEGSLSILPGRDELLWGSIAFLILLVVLLYVLYPKMREALKERTRRIQGQLEDAERTRREADQLLEQYRQQLAEARVEVQRIIDEGKRTAEAVRADLTAKAERDAQEIVQRAQADVSRERDRVMAELRGTLGDLSIQLATRVIERELQNPQSARALVDQAIEDLAHSNGSS